MNDRNEFLLHYFDKLWDESNFAKKIILQTIIALLGTFFAVMLTKVNFKIPIPVVAVNSLVLVILIWVLAHIEYASYWYNRNLAIISNIERQFFNNEDTSYIQYYFVKHRNHIMVPHFRLHYIFVSTLASCMLIYYFLTVTDFAKLQKYIPFLIAIFGIIILYFFNLYNVAKLKEFSEYCPGKQMNSKIDFKFGHGENGFFSNLITIIKVKILGSKDQ